MERTRFRRTPILILASLLVVFVCLLAATHFIGEGQVKSKATQSLVSSQLGARLAAPGGVPSIPQYRCAVRTVAPLLVRSTYAWDDGQRKEQGSTLYLWCFGRVIQIRESHVE